MAIPPAYHESLPCSYPYPWLATLGRFCFPIFPFLFPLRFFSPITPGKRRIGPEFLSADTFLADIDPEPSPSELAAAQALVAAEAEASPSLQKPSAGTVEATFSPALQAELTRIAGAQAATTLDLSRYEAQDSPSSLSALAKAYVSSVYLSGRLQNLSLLDKYGKNAWLVGNDHLEAELRSLEKELAEVKAQIDMANVQRRRRQEDVRGEMEALERTWREGVGRVLETEVALEGVRQNVRDELRRRSEQEH